MSWLYQRSLSTKFFLAFGLMTAGDAALGYVQAPTRMRIALSAMLAMVLAILLSLAVRVPLRRLRLGAARLAAGHTGLLLGPMPNDETGAVAAALSSLAEQVREATELAQRIAAGDAAMTTGAPCDSTPLGRGLQLCANNLRGLVRDSSALVTAAADGKSEARVDASSYSGGDFRRVAENMNRMCDDLRKPLAVATHVLEKFSHGELPWPVREECQGEHDRLKESTNRLITISKQRQEDMVALLQAAIDGRLEIRADITRYEGENRKLFEGINQLLDAVWLPIKEGNRVLCQIRAGNLRERMEIDCRGDHQKMKEAVNGVHDWLRKLVEYVTAIANGDMSAGMETSSASDQVHEWLMLLKDNIVELQAELERLITAAKQGDLLMRGDPSRFKGAYASLLRSANEMLEVYRSTMERVAGMTGPLSESAAEVHQVADQIGLSSGQTANQAKVVSSGSEQVSRNIQTVATAADGMGASVQHIARSTAEASRVALAAVTSAEATNLTIAQLGQSSAEIGEVVKVITAIAQQTKLLALNAAIEAARAGEAGKGFGVVANEVKELAKETAQATEDISRRIEAIQTDTSSAVAAIQQIGSVIGQINGIQNNVAAAVEEQSVTTGEIIRNLAEAAKGGAAISKSIAAVADAARSEANGAVQTQNSAETVARMAEQLNDLLAQFRYQAKPESVQRVLATKESWCTAASAR